MRIKLNFTKSEEFVPFDYQGIINTFIHDSLGRNNKYHDAKSNYCVSNLRGGKKVSGGLSFHKPYIIVTSSDIEFINGVIKGAYGRKLGYGMEFKNIEFMNENFHNGWNYFASLSPIFFKDKNTKRHITIQDENYESELKKHLLNKLNVINDNLKGNEKLNLNGFDVKVPNHKNHKVKKVFVNGIWNFSSTCHVNIKTNAKVAEFIYNIGLGQSTGCGFGTICKTENLKLY